MKWDYADRDDDRPDDGVLTIEEIGKALAGLVIGALGLLLLLKGRVGPR